VLLVVSISYAVLFFMFRKHAPPEGAWRARRGAASAI
jgi:hypothetical protein